MVICDQDNVVLITHLIEALDNKWGEVIHHTRKWLLKDDEEILLSGSALGDQFKERHRDLQQRGCIFLGYIISLSFSPEMDHAADVCFILQ